MKLNEILSELRLKIRANKLYDDDEIDDRLLKQWLHNQRELWIRNEVNKNRSIDDQIIQKLSLTMSVVDRSDCPLRTTSASILKSTQQIPKTIELAQGDGVIRVAPIDKMAWKFSYVPIERAQVGGNGKFNSNVIFAFRYNNYIYLTSKKANNYQKYIRYIMLYGLFGNPEELSAFTHIDGTVCYSDNDDYPLNRWMWNYIKDQIVNSEFNLIVSAPTDQQNDSEEQLTTTVNDIRRTK
jgi:hypothetical protein